MAAGACRILAVGLLAALAVTPSSVSAAGAADLRLKRVAGALSPAIVSGQSRGYAYLASPTTVVVRVPGEKGRSYPVAPGCTPVAITSGLLALDCVRLVVGQPALLDLADGHVTAVALRNTDTFAYLHTEAIGAHWLRVVASANPFGDGPHLLVVSGLIDHETGRVIRLGRDDPYPARSYIDLDRADPARPLCAPIKRRARGGFGDETRYATITRIGQWVLSGNDLQHCGARVVKHYPTGYHPSLGDDRLAYIRRPKRQIVALDLPTNRTWTAPWPSTRDVAPSARMAGRRLIVSSPSADGRSFTIYETGRAPTR